MSCATLLSSSTERCLQTVGVAIKALQVEAVIRKRTSENKHLQVTELLNIFGSDVHFPIVSIVPIVPGAHLK